MMELVIQNRTKKVWIQILSSVMRQVGDILGRAPQDHTGKEADLKI